MQTADKRATKKARGRRFQPGNPGRPPGATNRAARLAERLLIGEAKTITRKSIGLALDGNVPLLRDMLDRLA